MRVSAGAPVYSVFYYKTERYCGKRVYKEVFLSAAPDDWQRCPVHTIFPDGGILWGYGPVVRVFSGALCYSREESRQEMGRAPAAGPYAYNSDFIHMLALFNGVRP